MLLGNYETEVAIPLHSLPPTLNPQSTRGCSEPFSLRPPHPPPRREVPSSLYCSPGGRSLPWLGEKLYPRTHRSLRTPLCPEAPPSLLQGFCGSPSPARRGGAQKFRLLWASVEGAERSGAGRRKSWLRVREGASCSTFSGYSQKGGKSDLHSAG